VSGTRHLVAAGHYLAAQAGLQMLEAGGNAIDAGVAAGIALSVVQSDFVNFAGVAPMMIYIASERRVVTIDGLGVWPAAASLEFFQKRYGGRIPVGIHRTVVPAAPDAWISALTRYGTKSFAEAARAAIGFARNGFPVHPLMHEIITLHEGDYRRWPSNTKVYLPEGRPPAIGELFVQADLAATIQHMADEERAARGGRAEGLKAARDAFYLGDIARTIAGYHKENDGLLSRDDLARFECRVEDPLRIRFRDLQVFSCGPWCQGPALLQMLRIADGLPLKEAGHNSSRYVHLTIEAVKLAFADREAFYGDPRFVDVPIDRLLSESYSEERRRRIATQAASPNLPPPGEIAGAPIPFPVTADVSGPPSHGLDTSYVCVVDRQGNAFSATPSDVSVDTPVIPGTGLCPSSRGSQSWTIPGHPSSLAPGKRPRLTPNPALAIRNDGTLIPFGTPGGDVQCQAMLQVFVNHVIFGMNPQEAVEAPRFATYSAPDSFEPHLASDGRVMLEARFASPAFDELAALGHRPSSWPEWSWRAGGVCMISADPRSGVMTGGADPRRPSYVVGW